MLMLKADMKRSVIGAASIPQFPSSSVSKVKGESQGSDDEFYRAIRPLLIWGRITGLVPLSGVFQRDSSKLALSRGAGFVCLIIAMILLFSTILNSLVAVSQTSATPSDLAWSLNLVVFYGIGFFMYCYFLRNSQKLIDFISLWRGLQLKYHTIDHELYRDINWLAGIIFTSCLCEHGYAHLKFFPIVQNAEKRLLDRKDILERLKNASALETYYWRSNPLVGDFIPYSPIMAVILFMAAKFTIISWNYGDVIVACTSRALSGKFKSFCHKAKVHLVDDDRKLWSHDEASWIEFVRDNEILMDLVSAVDEFLSPVVFALYGVNVYYFCLQLNLGLTPSANSSAIASVYAVWSFLHLIGRLLVMSITAANINAQAQAVRKILRKCPQKCYTAEVERAERIIRTTHVGLTGLGCFTVTRNFILQMFNIVFTFEIVLLQTAAPAGVNLTAVKPG